MSNQFDVAEFAWSVCLRAYPQVQDGKRNRWDYQVKDILDYGWSWEYPDDDTDRPRVRKYGRLMRDKENDPNTIIVYWRLAGVDQLGMDAVNTATNFEISVATTQVKALNAFHWSLMRELRLHHGVNLSALLGDVEEDETVSKTQRFMNKAFRVWAMTVDRPVIGMNELFEAKE